VVSVTTMTGTVPQPEVFVHLQFTLSVPRSSFPSVLKWPYPAGSSTDLQFCRPPVHECAQRHE
jgi:hypothetical protein